MTVTSINNQIHFPRTGLDPVTVPGVKPQQPDLRKLASEFVNHVFYGSLLREFRDSQQSTILDGGPGGSTFMRQLDMELIGRISKRGDAPLVDALLRQWDKSHTLSSEIKRANNDTQSLSVLQNNKGIINV